MVPRIVAILAAGMWFALPASAAMRLDARFSLIDGNLALTRDNDAALTGRDLAGQVVSIVQNGEALEIRFDGFLDLPDESGGRNRLYSLSARLPERGPFAHLCRPDPQGREMALAIPDEVGGVSLTCTSGAEGKCVLFGYRPWDSKGGVPLRDLHRACVRMLRADYGGDDLSYTKDGTLIAFEDTLGIRIFPQGNDMPFEAAWGPDGALCVARGRIPRLADVDFLKERYPDLAPRLGHNACQESTMREDPRALLINRSAVPGVKPRR